MDHLQYVGGLHRSSLASPVNSACKARLSVRLKAVAIILCFMSASVPVYSNTPENQQSASGSPSLKSTDSPAPVSLKAGVTQNMVKTAPKNCGIWIIPGRGFVDSCEELETLVEIPDAENETATLELSDDMRLEPIEFSLDAYQAEKAEIAEAQRMMAEAGIPPISESLPFFSAFNMMGMANSFLGWGNGEEASPIKQEHEEKPQPDFDKSLISYANKTLQNLNNALAKVDQAERDQKPLVASVSPKTQNSHPSMPDKIAINHFSPSASTHIQPVKQVAITNIVSTGSGKSSSQDKWPSNPIRFVVKKVRGVFKWMLGRG